MNPKEIIGRNFPMGENTNSNIGDGVFDWQKVGGGKPFPTPPLGPVAKMVQNAKMGQGRLGAELPTPPLDTKSTGGPMGQPRYGDGGLPGISQAQDVTNSTTDLNVSASSENLSAKFKNPQKKSIVDGKGANQYQD